MHEQPHHVFLNCNLSEADLFCIIQPPANLQGEGAICKQLRIATTQNQNER